MYPTIIVILVYSTNSMEETYGISALIASGEVAVTDVEVCPATPDHISFAMPPSSIESSGIRALDGQTATAEGEMGRIRNHGDDAMDASAEKGGV